MDGDRAAFNSDGVLQSVVYPNADLVIIPTARPIGDITTSAYAQCLQRDQHGRCTVGNVNWNPQLLGNPTFVSVNKARETAVHEFTRTLP